MTSKEEFNRALRVKRRFKQSKELTQYNYRLADVYFAFDYQQKKIDNLMAENKDLREDYNRLEDELNTAGAMMPEKG